MGDPPEKLELSIEEQALYPPELAHAYRLIKSVAERLDRGDGYDREEARDLHGIARGLDERAAGIASGRAARRSLLGRLFKRLAEPR